MAHTVDLWNSFQLMKNQTIQLPGLKTAECQDRYDGRYYQKQDQYDSNKHRIYPTGGNGGGESSDKPEVEFGSWKFYGVCALGGALCCSATHVGVLPLDIVKCRLQTDKAKYMNLRHAYKTIIAEEGAICLVKGWLPTMVGYAAQGVYRFGAYEYLKYYYGTLLGEEMAYKHRTIMYLAASASAEFVADMFLAPFEAMKVRMQTVPHITSSSVACAKLMWKEEGIRSFYKGLPPLWGRQIPYTMVKFATFERTIEALYKHVVPKPREQCTKAEQLVVTLCGGYIAGVVCAIASHPPDTIVSKLNKYKGSTYMEVARKLGFWGMWQGLGARILMIGAVAAAQWFIYDATKVYFNVPRPPPPVMPESLKRKLEAAGEKVD